MQAKVMPKLFVHFSFFSFFFAVLLYCGVISFIVIASVF